MKESIKVPFFVFNPKSYLHGQALIDLAKQADKLASELGMTIFVTGPYANLGQIAGETEHILVTAQHMDGIDPGRGMGYVLAESLYDVGVRATFLNHAEHPMTLADLVKAIDKAKSLGMITIVCADSMAEAETIARLNPDIILCEPAHLIGTGQTSDEDYIKSTNQAIKAVNPNILVMQAAGISNPEDVYRTIVLGAEGTGCTSGIIKAESPSQMLEAMIVAADKAFKERGF